MDEHKVCLLPDLTADCTCLRTAAPDRPTELSYVNMLKFQTDFQEKLTSNLALGDVQHLLQILLSKQGHLSVVIFVFLFTLYCYLKLFFGTCYFL